MNLLAFARMVVAAQQNVVKYEPRATICPVCRELGLPPAPCTVYCTVKEVRHLTCSQCLSTFRAIGDEPEPKPASSLPALELGKIPAKRDKKKSIKHNITVRSRKMKSRSEIESELVLFRAARDAILGGSQSYSINGRMITRADLKTIMDEIKSLEVALDRASRRFVKSPVFGA